VKVVKPNVADVVPAGDVAEVQAAKSRPPAHAEAL
jgi:hypothetical protein